MVGCGDVDVPAAAGGSAASGGSPPRAPASVCDLDGIGADGVVETFHSAPTTEQVSHTTADATALYWVDTPGQRILRMGFGDAAPEVFATAVLVAEGPVLQGDFVYWRAYTSPQGTSTVLRRAPKADGSAVQDLSAPQSGAGLAVDAEWLYFSEAAGTGSSIRRMPKGGGASEVVLDGEYPVSSVTVDASAVSWIAAASANPPSAEEGSAGPFTAIRYLPHGAASAATLLDGAPAALAPSAAGDGTLYYLDQTGGWSLDAYGWSGIGAWTPGAAVWMPAQGPSAFSVPVSDAACVYWVAPRPPLEADGGIYDLQRAPHGGGAVETIGTVDAGDNGPRRPVLALSGDGVYWTLGSNYPEDKPIYRTSK